MSGSYHHSCKQSACYPPPYSDDVCIHVLFSTHHFVPAGSKLPMFAIIPPLQYHIIIHLAICHSLNQSAAHEIAENSNSSVCMNTVWDFQLPGREASHLSTITSIKYILVFVYTVEHLRYCLLLSSSAGPKVSDICLFRPNSHYLNNPEICTSVKQTFST